MWYVSHRSLRSFRLPPYSMGGEAGRPCRSIQEQVWRNGRPAPPAAAAWAAAVWGNRGAIDAYMGSREGGPKPCSGAVEFSVGGARTVILIWRDDFNICTHLCVKKKCGNRRDTKERRKTEDGRRKMQAKITNDRGSKESKKRVAKTYKRRTENKNQKLNVKHNFN